MIVKLQGLTILIAPWIDWLFRKLGRARGMDWNLFEL